MNSITGRNYRRYNGVSGINVALGIWVIISPFILGFARNEVAMWNNIAVGIAVALVALSGGNLWNVALGIWLIISPFVLGFANAPTVCWNNIILGALVLIVALTGSNRPARTATDSGAPSA